MNELINSKESTNPLKEELDPILSSIQESLETNFLGQSYERILSILAGINITVLDNRLSKSIKLAITILILILSSEMAVAQDASVSGAPAGLKLRSEPTTNSKVLQILPDGSKLRILNDLGDWDEVDVNLDGKPDGYVFEKYLEIGKEVTPVLSESETGPQYIFTAKNCNSSDGYSLLDSGSSMCYASLHRGSEYIGEGFYAHNTTPDGINISALKIGDKIQIKKDNGSVLNFKVEDRRAISNASDASKIEDANYSFFIWTTNKKLEKKDPKAKIVFYLIPY